MGAGAAWIGAACGRSGLPDLATALRGLAYNNVLRVHRELGRPRSAIEMRSGKFLRHGRPAGGMAGCQDQTDWAWSSRRARARAIPPTNCAGHRLISSCFSASIGARSRTHALPSCPPPPLAATKKPAAPARALARARIARPSSADKTACRASLSVRSGLSWVLSCKLSNSS